MQRRAWSLAVGPALGLTLAGQANADVDWSKAQPMTITMTEYRFVPEHIVLRHGVAYRLHFENAGKELHEFTAKDFFKSAAIRNPEALVAASQDVVLQPHETKDVFLVVDKPGHFSLSCADHDFLNMTGDITVE